MRWTFATAIRFASWADSAALFAPQPVAALSGDVEAAAGRCAWRRGGDGRTPSGGTGNAAMADSPTEILPPCDHGAPGNAPLYLRLKKTIEDAVRQASSVRATRFPRSATSPPRRTFRVLRSAKRYRTS